MAKELVLKNIMKTMDGQTVLDNINLHMDPGERLSILGPSGSGKTTLLRIIAGLTQADSGKIICDSVPMEGVMPHKRNFGMMFQDLALFPHLNVFKNIAFGLEMKKWDKPRIKKRIKETLSLVGLEGFETRGVNELSGGERQRIALARTLAPSPDLLMLDEPLSALDRVLRKRLLKELTSIIAAFGVTTIFVTHDQKEAFAAGDRIMVMNKGKIEQISAPKDLLNFPANRWVKDFLGL